MKDLELAAKFEARHKLIDTLIADAAYDQVLEIASGLSTRGLSMTANPDSKYVELDLPLMITMKRQIVSSLQHKGVVPERKNLYLEGGNALSEQDLIHAASHFDQSKPISIITEGLLRYLTIDEQREHANHIRTVLKKFGGVWITPDISLISHDVVTSTKLRRQKFAELTGKDVSNNRFLDMDHAIRFFNDLGFTIATHSFLEVQHLDSPLALHLSPQQVAQVNKSAVAFVMRLA